MNDGVRFPYLAVRNALGDMLQRPILPVTLTSEGTSLAASGLLDSGADVNVLPFALGIALGLHWEQARTGLQLSGNLAPVEARGILLTCVVGQLAPVRLAFAWTRSDTVPLLFGQTNFFAEYDVCFFGAQKAFEVRRKSSS